MNEVPEPIFIPLYSAGNTMAECGCSAASTPAGIHVYPCMAHSGIENAFPQPHYVSWTVEYDATPGLDDRINAGLEKVPGARIHQVVPFQAWEEEGKVTKVLVVYEGLMEEDDTPQNER